MKYIFIKNNELKLLLYAKQARINCRSQINAESTRPSLKLGASNRENMVVSINWRDLKILHAV